MLADCVQHGGGGSGANSSAGIFAGVFISGEKLGFAAGALLSGVILGVSGLVETTAGSVLQPQSALNGIRFSLSLAPVILNGLAFCVLGLYRPFERQMMASLIAETAA